jgi:hypothetical protein
MAVDGIRRTRARRSRILRPAIAVLVLLACAWAAASCGRAEPGDTREGSSKPRLQAAFEGATGSEALAAPLATTGVPHLLEPGNADEVVDPVRLERLVARNLAPSVSLPESLLAMRIAAWRTLPVGERIARWAQLFADRGDNVYLFGPKAGGYVAESLLVEDHRFDCVLLFYRCTELARATSPRDAIVRALTTRFAGGDPASVVGTTGSVDYDDPSHLDYSEDFAATGLWGRDVTREVGVAVPDDVGTSRYPAGSRVYIPTRKLRPDRLRDGDLLFFVLDEHHEAAAKLREKYGLLIGHQGIVRVENGDVHLLHAAQSDLPGVYTGNRVVEVPLATYLGRLDRFKGIMVSRIEEPPTDTGRR